MELGGYLFTVSISHAPRCLSSLSFPISLLINIRNSVYFYIVCGLRRN